MIPLLLFAIAMASASAQANTDFPVQVSEDQTSVSFGTQPNAPKTIKSGLFELSYLGVLHPHDGSMPYYLFTGIPCKTCTAERALYLIRPGTESAAAKITMFVQPGKIIDPKHRGTVLEARAFYGKCLSGQGPDSDEGYVVFQRERVDRRHGLMSSVFEADAAPDFVREKLLERHLPPISRTLSLVRKKHCHEIEGRNRLIVLNPHGLNSRELRSADADDDDSDVEPRKNQSDHDLAPQE